MVYSKHFRIAHRKNKFANGKLNTSGGFQISNNGDISKLFEPYLGNLGKILKYTVFFRDVREFKNLVKYYLKHENERKEIAAETQQILKEEHTYTLRIKKIFDDINLSLP